MGSDAYVSASGATAQLRELDVVSNNLANVGTPGFKRSKSVFRSVLEGALLTPDGGHVPGATATAYVSTDQIGADFTRGAAEHTGSKLHAMIDGTGFFEIETANGPRYTRAGNFSINRAGLLATPFGDPVVGEAGPIPISSSDAEIHPNGMVTDRNGNVFGRLKIVDFEDPQGLVREGQSIFRSAEAAGESRIATPGLIPQSVEGSNVETARELAAMVMLQRAFETNLRAMQVNDETTERLIEGIR